MAANISPIAQSGFADASSYDAHRPSYPAAAVSALLQNLNMDNELHGRIVDLAAGTGKFTELLAQREEDYEIVAVEPHAGMREVLQRKKLKGVTVVEGSAADMRRVERGWADAVMIAQAFHWFAQDEALHEIYRVLKPGGCLGLIWNIEDYNSRTDWTPSTEWEGKMKAITWTFDDREPRFRHNEWSKVFDNQLKDTPWTIIGGDPLFSLPLGEHFIKWIVWLSKDAVWERFRTISHIANLKDEQLEKTKREVYEALDGADVETNGKGEVAVHGQTVSYWTTAIPGAPLRQGG